MPGPISPTERLDEAVAEYLAAVESGVVPDRAGLLDRYADVSAELAQFLTDHDRLIGLARPIRALVAIAGNTPREVNGSDATATFDPAAPPARSSADSQSTIAGQRIGDY